MNVGVLECEYIGSADRSATGGASRPVAGDYTKLFEQLLASSGNSDVLRLYPVDVRHGVLPSSPGAYDAYIITGSYAGVYDGEPWIESLLQFIRDAHSSSIPLVGICFGHQALAHALGGRAAKAEIGWQLGVVHTTIHSEAAGTPQWLEERREALNLVYMHQDQVMELPPGALNFAETQRCPYAGFIIGETALGLQGHPEFSADLTKSLIRAKPDHYGREVATAALASLEHHVDRAPVARWIARFLETAPRG
ncbi:MAG: hypothetical protein R6V29_09175 [Spirochaetia bacterium]